MAGFVESRNGRYRARFTPPGGKETSETFDRKVDANDWLDRQRGDAVRGVWLDPRGGKTLFEDYAAGFHAGRVHLRESSATKEEANLRNHIMPAFKGRQLRAIDRRGVQNWVNLLVAQGLAPTTIEGIYGQLVRVMLGAVEDKLIPESPCRSINLPEISTEMTIPTVEQLEIVAGRLHRYRRAVPLVAGAGLRQGELFGLTADRIDFLRRELRVDRQLQRRPKLQAHIDEHGRMPRGVSAVPLGGGWFLVDPKSKRSKRVVPVGQHTLGVLAAQIEEYPPTGVGLVFTSSTGRPVTRATFDNAWELATRKRSGRDPERPDPGEYRAARDPALLPYFTIHDDRHFYASLLIAKGVPVTRVAATLGHTVEECLSTYAHLWPDDDHRVREAVDEVFGDEGPAAGESRPEHGLG